MLTERKEKKHRLNFMVFGIGKISKSSRSVADRHLPLESLSNLRFPHFVPLQFKP